MYISFEILDMFYFLKCIAYAIRLMLEYVDILQTIKTVFDLILSTWKNI